MGVCPGRRCYHGCSLAHLRPWVYSRSFTLPEMRGPREPRVELYDICMLTVLVVATVFGAW